MEGHVLVVFAAVDEVEGFFGCVAVLRCWVVVVEGVGAVFGYVVVVGVDVAGDRGDGITEKGGE